MIDYFLINMRLIYFTISDLLVLNYKNASKYPENVFNEKFIKVKSHKFLKETF